MKGNYKLGAILSILGILAGLFTLYFLAQTYNTVIHTHFGAGEWEESNTVRFVYAVLGWFGTAAGALSAVVLWGFLKNRIGPGSGELSLRQCSCSPDSSL